MGGEIILKNNIQRDVGTAVKIQCVMTRAGISQAQLAMKIGVSFPMVNCVIWGTKTSPRVREGIATELGFESWDELKHHREVV